MPRWNVERPSGESEDVGAWSGSIGEGGTLGFLNQEGHLVIAYASNQWVTVTYEGEE